MPAWPVLGWSVRFNRSKLPRALATNLNLSARQRCGRVAAAAVAGSEGPGLQQQGGLSAQAGGCPERKRPVAVVAFGGNALLRRGEPLTTENQQRNAARAAAAVKELAEEFDIVVTHGNGPQVGLLALQDPEAGLDVLDAETEGQLGYLLELELQNALGREVATLLTQVVVDPADPAFQHPSKPVGPHYSKEDAERYAQEKGWAIAQDGDRYRRVVASPEPRDIVETHAIEVLLRSGILTICCGGGGIPVALDKQRHRRYGVEAVVDKDAASALLAAKIGADWLLMLTDADAIYDPERWPDAKQPLPSPLTPSALARYKFAAGSMGPKVAAAVRFVQASGGKAGVGCLEDAAKIVRGQRGTVIGPD